MKAIFPVIFTQTDDIVLVEVPDLEILTEGADMADAIYMARDAIGLKGITIQDDGEEIPAPSKFNDIDPLKASLPLMVEGLCHWLMWTLQSTAADLIIKQSDVM